MKRPALSGRDVSKGIMGICDEVGEPVRELQNEKAMFSPSCMKSQAFQQIESSTSAH